jgi:hypothetical protein
LLGAPGEDGVFRYSPSPVEPEAAVHDDSEEVADWFDTQTDPAIAQAVARAEAEARVTSSMPIPPAIEYSVSTQQPLHPTQPPPPPSGAHHAQ